MPYRALVLLLLLVAVPAAPAAGQKIFDHTAAHSHQDLYAIPSSAIVNAKNVLHVAYGHTSHGSQIITGMNNLDTFMHNRYGTPTGLYSWNDGPMSGRLDIDDYFEAGDLGNPDRTTWASRTRTYLNNPANSDVNVVMWSWCGQADTTAANIDLYLSQMTALENDYPGVFFVYMTGHLNGTGASGNLNLRNQQIRDYCQANDKWLYDFADIESWDPDGNTNYMQLMANDNCDYDSDGNGTRDKNWALDWQNSHTQNVDWYSCSAVHSQALNGNLKAYAAWHMFSELGTAVPEPATMGLLSVGLAALVARRRRRTCR